MSDTKGWELFVSIVPKDDLVEHELTEDCICGPDWSEDECDLGPMLLHHALDGRI